MTTEKTKNCIISMILSLSSKASYIDQSFILYLGLSSLIVQVRAINELVEYISDHMIFELSVNLPH